MNKLLLFLTAATIVCSTPNIAQANNNDIITVEGTKYASLRSAEDVIIQLPSVSFKYDNYYVTGRGIPAIYIGKRKITNLNELKELPASYIKEVKLITEPGADYDKNVQAVIVITLSDAQVEGFQLNNNLSFKQNHFFAPSDQLTMSYKRTQYQLGGQLGFSEIRSLNENQSFTHTYKYDGHTPNLYSESHEVSNPYNHGQLLQGKVFGSVNFNIDHSLTASYYVDWLRRNDTDKYNDVTTVYGANNGVIDKTHILSCDTVYSSSSNPTTRHEFNIEYNGKVGNVSLNAGNNVVRNTSYNTTYKFANFKSITDFEIRTNEYNNKLSTNTRSFLNASLKLNCGTLLGAGAEVATRHMDAQLIDIANAAKDNTHGITNEHTYAGYVNAAHEVGNWSFAAGLRYAHVGFKYIACPDDKGLIITGWDKFSFRRNYNNVYPNVMTAVKLGNSKLTMSYTRSYNQFNMANIKVVIMGSFSVDKYMLLTERIHTTSLTWEYKWLTLNATHRRFNNPLCNTTNGNVDFNANDYDALDFNVALTPKIGVWQPTLTMHAHKQWFDIQLCNGETNLNKPLFEIQLFNNIVLPRDWTIRLNGNWRSRGNDRNIKYFKHNFQLDAAIQKVLFNKHLVVELDCNNVLRDSWDDVTVYTDYRGLANKGRKNRIERSLILSLRYTL